MSTLEYRCIRSPALSPQARPVSAGAPGAGSGRARALRTGWILLALLILAGSPAQADEDHEQARRLLANKHIVALEQILHHARSVRPGRLLEAELERHEQGYVYELEWVDAKGVVWEMKYDASTGRFLHDQRED